MSEQLRVELERLPSEPLRFFAAACAERTWQHAKRRGDGGGLVELRGYLDALWSGATDCDLQVMIDRCQALIPADEDADESYDAIAENAAYAVCYSLMFVQTDDVQNVMWAATHAHEAVDYIAHTSLDADFNDAAAMLAVAAHPVVQHELEQQLADIEDPDTIKDRALL